MIDIFVRTCPSTSVRIAAALIAKEANVESLLIGHFSARYKEIIDFENEAKTVFKNTTAINDGDIFEIKLNKSRV